MDTLRYQGLTESITGTRSRSHLFVAVRIVDETFAVLLLGKLCDEHGPTDEWVSSTQPWLTKQGRNFHANRKISYLTSSLDCRVHLLHRHRRSQVHQEHQVQLRSEVTSSHQETGRGIQQGIHRNRMTGCEIFHNGWRSSQNISRIQKCWHPHTFLMTQIRNAVRKWHQGSTVSILSSLPKAPKLRNLLRFAEDALAKQYVEQKRVVI